MNRIKAIRKEKGMQQIDLAKVVGVSQPFMHDLENNRRGARPDTYKRIADALGVSERELFEMKRRQDENADFGCV